MTYVKARPGESVESLLRRFKKAVDNAGILSTLKRYEAYEKPSVLKKRKKIAAIKREAKQVKKKEKAKRKKKSGTKWKWNRDRTKKIQLQGNRSSSSKFKNKPSRTINKNKG